jgi:undecaprenyl-diphosphatase
LSIAGIPALIFGKLFSERIDSILEKPLIIAIIMIAGGVIFLFIESMFKEHTIHSEENISVSTSFKIGLFQCLAIVFPGLSRSAATIIGGMSLKLTRAAAAEFSFFLAVPTMAAATLYSIFLKNWNIDDAGHAIDNNKITLGGRKKLVFFVVSKKSFKIKLVGNLIVESICVLGYISVKMVNQFG